MAWEVATVWTGCSVTSYLRAPQEQDPLKTAIEMDCMNKESIEGKSNEKKEKMKLMIEDEPENTSTTSSL